jgi:TnpA family transposase
MKGHWEIDELIEHFVLRPEEIALFAGSDAANQLGMAVLLKFFQHEARFPINKAEVPDEIVSFLAHQLSLDGAAFAEYKWYGRRIKTHRSKIRHLYEFKRASHQDQRKVQTWLYENVVAQEQNVDKLKELTYERFRTLRRTPPTAEQVETLINGAISTYEQHFYQALYRKLPQDLCQKLASLLGPSETATENDDAYIPLHDLKEDPGEPNVASVKITVTRLEQLQALNIPQDLFAGYSQRFLQKYKQRVASEKPSSLRRHLKTPAIGYTLLATFCGLRLQEVTDQVIDLFDQIINSVRIHAEKKVIHTVVEDVKHVRGKDGMFYRLSLVMLEKPDGVVREVLYPVVNAQQLQDVVKEYEATGSAFDYSVQTMVYGSYNHHYRQMLPYLLRVLDFHASNPAFQPVLDGIEIVKRYSESKDAWYPAEETVNVPLEGVVDSEWHSWVKENDDIGQVRIKRVNYELCVLQTLREMLRRKQIWVSDADHYRNPDADLPTDFKERRSFYYEMLRQTENVEDFIQTLKQSMIQELKRFNDNLPKNPFVKITKRKGKPIKVAKLSKQEEPINLRLLKQEIKNRWGVTNLLDVLKETEFRVGLAQYFPGFGVGRRLSAVVFQKRLLLVLYALGTNTGLTRLLLSEDGRLREKYDDLEYIQRRYIHREALRNAIAAVVNATFAARRPEIWGDATTACASDSKKFAANDNNLLTQWHNRYHGPGVLIYWHVERGSACIFSQLKSCSSSEVAAMIEGVLHHCTAMHVERNYVDTHGQSEVAFAFSYLLHFDLMPRLADIAKQHLYLPDENMGDRYPNLMGILSRAIDWNLIREQYDQMVLYATALRLRTADAEAILKRFRTKSQHPTYKALLELGKVIKTIFLCRYLDNEALRREIHEGLNVVESWNATNRFIFFAKNSEFMSNRVDRQEISMLALHLLQSCLIFMNTLLLQKILSDPTWQAKMTDADWRGMTPLFHNHVTPYGYFKLNMKRRLQIEDTAWAA